MAIVTMTMVVSVVLVVVVAEDGRRVVCDGPKCGSGRPVEQTLPALTRKEGYTIRSR